MDEQLDYRFKCWLADGSELWENSIGKARIIKNGSVYKAFDEDHQPQDMEDWIMDWTPPQE